MTNTAPADHRHVIVVPVEGIPEMIHSPHPLDVAAMLVEAAGGGVAVGLNFQVDGEPGGLIYLVTGVGTENERARLAFADLTGVHVAIFGPCAFVGLSEDNTVRLLKNL